MKIVNKSLRSLSLSALALLLGTTMIGCGGMEGDEAIETQESALTTSTGPTLGNYFYGTVTDSAGRSNTYYWMTCASNQVVVGWHRAQQKVLCVNLPANVRRVSTSLQLPGQSSQVNGMQACPSGQYIQGIANSGTTGYLLCAAFWNNTTNQPVLWSGGAPTTDSSSQSVSVYGFSSPNMHVCPSTAIGGGAWDAKGMVGLHIKNEVLSCVK